MCKILLTLLLSLHLLHSYGQNYQTISIESPSTYSNTNWAYHEDYPNQLENSYFIVKADSSKVIDGNLVLYHFNILRNDWYRKCIQTPMNAHLLSPNWTGPKTVIKPNGDNIYFTFNADSIRIKTSALPGSSWHLMDINNDNYFEATVTSKIEAPVLGTLDSLKIITLTLKNSTGSVIAHDFNGKQFFLSKNYGFIKAFDFSNFPNDTSAFFLQGRTNPNKGIYHLTAREVYDYNVNDTFHFEHSVFIAPDIREEKHQYVILSKTVSANEDTLTYKKSRLIVRETYQANIPKLERDTIVEKIIISQHTFLNEYPHKLYVLDTYYSAIGINLGKSSFLNRLQKTYGPIEFYTEDNTCYNEVFYTGGLTLTNYVEGLGDCDESYQHGTATYSKALVYYRKGNEVFGTPINFAALTAVAPKRNQVTAIVAPNPFNEHTTLTFDNPTKEEFRLTIFDSLGKLIKEYTSSDEEITIENDGTMKGIYFYKLYNGKNEVGAGKLLVY